MYSLNDILNVNVKKEVPEETSCSECSSQMISSNGVPAYSVQHGTTEKPFPGNVAGHQRGSLSPPSARLVPSLEIRSNQADFLKIQRSNIQGTQYNKKAFNRDMVGERRGTASVHNMVSNQTTSLKLTTYPVHSLREITAKGDVMKIKISNVQGTPFDRKGFSDDITRQKRVTPSAYNIVSRETSSLPRTSTYPVPSRKDIYPKEDVVKIKISNVQGTPSNNNAKEAFDNDFISRQSHVSRRNESNRNVESRFDHGSQEKMPLPKQLFTEQQLFTQKGTPPVEEKVRSTKTDQSSVLNRKLLTNTAQLQLQNYLSRNRPIHKADMVETTVSTHQMNNQYQLPFYQMDASEMMPAYQFDTRNGSPEIGSQTDTIMGHPPNLVNSHTTVPLHHMGAVDENTRFQIGDVAKSSEIYQPDLSFIVSSYPFSDQKGMQFRQNYLYGSATNLNRNASTCKCCCHAQSQSQSSLPPAFGLENQRASVIMVPRSGSHSTSVKSHVPLKGNVVDSDSSDEDGETERYFRMNINGKKATFKLTKEDWERIPIKQFPSGGRLLSGDWTKIFLSKVKESNPWCSLRFKNNHVRSENSRKIHSAVFFRGGAECKRPECNVKVRFVIQKEKGKYVYVTYIGDVCHSSQPDESGDRNYKKKNEQNQLI